VKSSLLEGVGERSLLEGGGEAIAEVFTRGRRGVIAEAAFLVWE